MSDPYFIRLIVLIRDTPQGNFPDSVSILVNWPSSPRRRYAIYFYSEEFFFSFPFVCIINRFVIHWASYHFESILRLIRSGTNRELLLPFNVLHDSTKMSLNLSVKTANTSLFIIDNLNDSYYFHHWNLKAIPFFHIIKLQSLILTCIYVYLYKLMWC